ncbi:exodeoxyribonuclease VII small subunit [Roseospira marina]|uniref:Exodeoxyribonuclease 7 small subunit n=1 Tax=Roseospira marina TaxID=140057 RepID=A0A5M6IBK4_9PROT|nr:exodeoxyribonuclease VII small subunit [Roseospira marina]KAA5605636.1 exodeoxyribonuclease VII small subunit [Roseospira marina]MBB4313290.1 exodeoxyribonuclease VII small subunit [Roseospira marina]MBB5085969.1 exodeoxyribonuclease VII small subunit [Roseospira marina]
MASKTASPVPESDTAASAPPPDIAALSFEEALKALEEIVRHLETGRVDLDAAVTAYERGVWLRKHCEARLAEARSRVERIGAGPDGAPSTAPLDVDP